MGNMPGPSPFLCERTTVERSPAVRVKPTTGPARCAKNNWRRDRRGKPSTLSDDPAFETPSVDLGTAIPSWVRKFQKRSSPVPLGRVVPSGWLLVSVARRIGHFPHSFFPFQIMNAVRKHLKASSYGVATSCMGTKGDHYLVGRPPCVSLGARVRNGIFSTAV